MSTELPRYTEYGLPILRLKLRAGDPEIEVTGECLLAMMRINPAGSLDFVAEKKASSQKGDQQQQQAAGQQNSEVSGRPPDQTAAGAVVVSVVGGVALPLP